MEVEATTERTAEGREGRPSPPLPSAGDGRTDAGRDDDRDIALSRFDTGTVIAGRYEVRALLGVGGMGAVYRVRDHATDRYVALKALLPSLTEKSWAIARFRREVDILLRLNHPGIVKVLDAGEARERELSFFTMELLHGETLRDWLTRRAESGIPVTPDEALDIAHQLASTLAYAHEHTVHRDLKPENVFLTVDSGRASGVRIRVLDFGVAKLTNPSRSRHLSTAVGLGTALYMAPEQQLNAASVDGRADLYAVGVMLYEMLTEHLPLGRFRAPSEERKDLPPEIDALALCLLDREPDLRFDDAGALLRAIERARAAIQSRTTRRAVRRRRRRTRRLKRSTLLGPVAGVAMLILLGGGMIRLARSLGARPHSPAVARSAEPPQSDLELEPVLELEPRLETEPVLEVEPFVSPSPPPRRWAPRKEPSPVLRHAAQIVTSQVRGLPVPEIPSWAPAKKPSAMVQWALGKLISAPRNMALPAPPSFRPAKQPSAVVRAMADSVTAQLQRGAATIRTIGTIETPTSVAPPVTATPAPTGWSGEPLPARLTRGLSAPSLVYTTSRIDPASGSALTIEMVAFRGPSGDTRYAARTEATRGAYAAFCEAAPRKAPPPTGWPESSDHPVVNVSFRDAEAFAKWLDLGIPTEAEWIALAGGPDRKHPWGDAVADGHRLNLCDRSCPEDYDWKERTIDDGAAYTAPVGSYPAGASPSGALDLLGNVSEWCIGDRGAPLIKGGSWDFDRAALNLGWSSPLEPTYRDETIGIRLVLSGRTTR